MGSTSDGSGATGLLADPDEGRGNGRPRSGLLGRLFQVLNKGEPGNADLDAGRRMAPATVAATTLAILKNLRVDDVSIPKSEIVAVPIDIGRDDLVEVFRKHGFSRLPVYKGTMDHPQGSILLKDLALQHGFGAGGRFSLRRLLRPVLFAPPSMPVGVLLQKMQKERVHMAMVIDEYGGVDGLVTIEDLIETVIGEIDDEHDEEEGALWILEKPGVYVAQANVPLDDFETAVGQRLRTSDEDEGIDTLGGLVFLRSGQVPARGEIIQHESGVVFEVMDADPRRIKRVRVRLPEAAGNAEAEQAPEPEKAPEFSGK